MAPEEGEAIPEDVVDFLVAEYNAINEEGRRLRVEGLNKLNFFLTLTVALFAGVVGLYQAQANSNSPDYTFVQLIAVGASLFLIVIGWFAFLYTIQRDIFADFNIRATGRISRYFSNSRPRIRPYLLWQDHDEPTGYLTHNRSAIRRIIQVVLSFLVALVTGLTSNFILDSSAVSFATGTLGLLISWGFFHWYAARRLRAAFSRASAEVRFPKSQH